MIEFKHGAGRRLQERHLKDALSEVKMLRARITTLEAALNDAKQHFLADEPLKAFVEICAALAGGEDGHK